MHVLFTKEAQLVGIDGPREDLVGWLMEEESRLRVLAVVGFGGLGKTATCFTGGVDEDGMREEDGIGDGSGMISILEITSGMYPI